jgi:hypothetical protein
VCIYIYIYNNDDNSNNDNDGNDNDDNNNNTFLRAAIEAFNRRRRAETSLAIMMMKFT